MTSVLFKQGCLGDEWKVGISVISLEITAEKLSSEE